MESVSKLCLQKKNEAWRAFEPDFRGGKKEKLAVSIPAGIQPGKRLRLKGKGLERNGGAPPGDLFLTIKVKKDR